MTHGITFLPLVDSIVVMKNGEIAEAGTFKDLMEKNGEFSQFLAEHTKHSDNESGKQI